MRFQKIAPLIFYCFLYAKLHYKAVGNNFPRMAYPFRSVLTTAAACQTNNYAKTAEKKEEYTIRVILLGDSGVGKSALMMRAIDDKFSEELNVITVGVDFRMKAMTVDGHSIRFQLWDTAGQKKYKCITRSYVAPADGVIYMFDITNRESFDNVVDWAAMVDGKSPSDKKCKVLVGSKKDIAEKKDGDSTIDNTEGAEKARELETEYFEMSSRTGIGLDTIFISLARQYIEYMKENRQSEKDHLVKKSVVLQQPAPQKAATCCH